MKTDQDTDAKRTKMTIESLNVANFELNRWVIFGGGRRHWLPKVAKDPEDHMEEGRRLDGRNLVDDWLRDKRKRGIKAAYVWNKQQMDKLEMNMQQVL
ncbi:hypothetical protein WDU94_015640, partial [Cyamophila willieti]